MKILNPLKKLGASIIATGVTLTMAACYGVYEEYSNSPWVPKGKVTNSETNIGIRGLIVCTNQEDFRGCTMTDSNGNYELWDEVPDSIRYDSYEVCVEDIDGSENGVYEKECKTIDAYTEEPVVNFSLTPVVE
jgi:hypothetical protein